MTVSLESYTVSLNLETLQTHKQLLQSNLKK